MASFVSIDWDFFIPHGMFKESIKLPKHNAEMPGMLVYDWQMSEERSSIFEGAIWETRAHNFTNWGLDIEKLLEPPLSVEDFAAQVTARMDDYSSPMAWHADSHAWGAILSRDLAKEFGPLHVFNFDAHHDLGYNGKDSLHEYRTTSNLACDNWALIGLHEGWISDYTLVYPDWLGMNEWVRKPHLDKYKGRIHRTTWGKWKGEIEEPEGMFFCRSSSWTPPWLDSGFQALIEEFGYADCLTCAQDFKAPYDTCHEREWDWDEVNARNVERTKAVAELRERMEKAS